MEKDNLAKHGSIMLFASGLAFLFGYLFHSYMGRNLGPEEYGGLDSLLSVFYIFLIPISTIQAVVARFSSVYIGNNRPDCIKNLMFEGFKKLLAWGFIVLIFFSILSPITSNALKIHSVFPSILLGMATLLAFILPISRGVLQGVQNFNHLGLNISSEKIILFISGVGLIGFGVTGAVISIVLSQLFVLLISFIPLHTFKPEKSKQNLKKAVIVKYSIPVFISLSAIAIMSNIDMIFVKHYFDPVQAGGYAAIDTMGKILFFLSFNIANVIYPKSSILFVQKKDSAFLLRKGLLYMGAISSFTILIYAYFPEQLINMVFGAQYLSFKSLLALYSLVMSLMAFVVVIVHYNFSTTNFIHIRHLIFFTILEVMLLILFHNSLIQVILVMLISSLILLISILKNSSIINSITIYGKNCVKE